MNWKRTTSDMIKKKIIKTKTKTKTKAKTKAKSKAKAKAKAKHKPSTKRTLEEVLSSLQDLTKNELSDVDLHSRAGTEPEKKQTTGPVPENPGTDDDNFNDNESIELDFVPVQVELVSGETGDIFEGLELLPDVQITDENQIDQTEQPGETNQSDQTDPELNDIRWEDIPVLEDVAEDLPDDQPENQLGTEQLDARALDAIELRSPDPQQARNIAIQVAARLNIEMRKQGLEGLDIATINRLRDLLVKELAKAATKSENDEP